MLGVEIKWELVDLSFTALTLVPISHFFVRYPELIFCHG